MYAPFLSWDVKLRHVCPFWTNNLDYALGAEIFCIFALGAEAAFYSCLVPARTIVPARTLVPVRTMVPAKLNLLQYRFDILYLLNNASLAIISSTSLIFQLYNISIREAPQKITGFIWVNWPKPVNPPTPGLLTQISRFESFTINIPEIFDKKRVKYAKKNIYKSLGPPDHTHPHLG